MRERTLVCMVFRDDYVGLRTVSRSRKSPHRFYIFRHSLEELEHRSEVIINDIRSFAILRRNAHVGTIEIEFTWLGNEGDGVAGYQDTIILPYDRLMECLSESKLQGEPVIWKTLSIDDSRRQPWIIFHSQENLKAALGNGIIRRKLIRILRDQSDWNYSERVEIYDDFMPYSFTFKEIKNGKPGIVGGLILHGQDNLRDAYYSIHT